MARRVQNPWIFPGWLAFATFVITAMALTLVLNGISGTKTWARTAKLVPVTVQNGDTGEDIMRALLPADRKETENLGFLLSVVTSRTGEEYGEIVPGQELQMPIPYGEWLQHKIWPW